MCCIIEPFIDVPVAQINGLGAVAFECELAIEKLFFFGAFVARLVGGYKLLEGKDHAGLVGEQGYVQVVGQEKLLESITVSNSSIVLCHENVFGGVLCFF